MSPKAYRQALIDRGFHFCEKKSLWIGPYNVQTNGQWDWDLRPFADSARVEALAVIDEHLRDKRGLPRPPASGGPGAGLYSFT